MLEEKTILGYWLKRARDQGERAIGHADLPLEGQREMSDKTKKFIAEKCPTNLLTLDYGCGVGRYADLFEKYIGYDITEQFLRIARKNNPSKYFFQGVDPCLRTFDLDIEMFMSVTVLQHNSIPVVLGVFESLAKHIKHPLTFCLLENTTANAQHCKGRKPKTYIGLLEEFFKVTATSVCKFNGNHTLLIAKTK